MPPKGTIPFFKIAGIQVYLHWAWFVVAIIQIQRMDNYSSLIWSVLEYLTLFAIVLTHEFGHALACRQVGGRAEQILLWPLGGVAYVDAPQRPGAMLWSIAAGPLVNVVLVPILLMTWFVASSAAGGGKSDFVDFLVMVNLMNAGLLIFNMLPIYPLDGGKILHSLLWYVVGRAKSLMAAVIIGFIGVGLLGLLAIKIGDIWLGVLVFFAGSQCLSGYRQAKALRSLEALPRRTGVACPSCGTNPPMAMIWRCGRCQASFDTFQTQAVCPGCQTRFSTTTCVDCGTSSEYAAWVEAAAGSGVPPKIIEVNFG